MRFFKLSGSGNDFVFLDGRTTSLEEWPTDRINEICARGTGVGADGLVILQPESRTAHHNGAARIGFHYFNADGHRSDMCGNASLCAARLATRLEMAGPGGLILKTDIGDVPARCLPGAGERAEIILPDVDPPTIPNIDRNESEAWMIVYDTGVPHIIVRVPDVDAESADPDTRGRTLRHHEAVAPHGANVNFVDNQADGLWRYRTFERGVEGETLACGTGAVAVAAALRYREAGKQSANASPIGLRTRSGRILEVGGQMTPDGALESPTLAGEGRLVFIGEIPES